MVSIPRCPVCGSEGHRSDTNSSHYDCFDSECPIVIYDSDAVEDGDTPEDVLTEEKVRKDALWAFSKEPRTVYVMDIHWRPGKVELRTVDFQGHIEGDEMRLKSFIRWVRQDDVFREPI